MCISLDREGEPDIVVDWPTVPRETSFLTLNGSTRKEWLTQWRSRKGSGKGIPHGNGEDTGIPREPPLAGGTVARKGGDTGIPKWKGEDMGIPGK